MRSGEEGMGSCDCRWLDLGHALGLGWRGKGKGKGKGKGNDLGERWGERTCR